MTLLASSPAEVTKLITDMENEVRGIKEAALTMAWHLRGGATYEDILNMSVDERKTINKIIEAHMETTKKTGLNYF